MAQEATDRPSVGWLHLYDVVRFQVTKVREVVDGNFVYTEVYIESWVKNSLVAERWYKVGDLQNITIDLKVT
jgi:hypothetical protein